MKDVIHNIAAFPLAIPLMAGPSVPSAPSVGPSTSGRRLWCRDSEPRERQRFSEHQPRHDHRHRRGQVGQACHPCRGHAPQEHEHQFIGGERDHEREPGNGEHKVAVPVGLQTLDTDRQRCKCEERRRAVPERDEQQRGDVAAPFLVLDRRTPIGQRGDRDRDDGQEGQCVGEPPSAMPSPITIATATGPRTSPAHSRPVTRSPVMRADNAPVMMGCNAVMKAARPADSPRSIAPRTAASQPA